MVSSFKRGDNANSISSVDRVYNEIRTNIILCRHKPGSALRLDTLVTDYGVSLVPIREALRKLEVERLVVNRRNLGASVATVSADDVEDAYDTRLVLESEAFRRAWSNLDDTMIASSQTSLDRMFEAFAAGRLVEGADLHRAHHSKLWERTDSLWLQHLIQILWSHTERYRNLALSLHVPTPSPDEYHLLVLDAIRRGDLSAAIFHTGEELATAKAVVVDHLRRHHDDDTGDASQSA